MHLRRTSVSHVGTNGLLPASVEVGSLGVEEDEFRL
jgi:hypothetical protein